jgi:platelet-activating factor acetylhydrolase IB subunit alpha
VQDLAFNESGTLLASCSADLTIKLWDVTQAAYACVKTLYGHDHNVSALAFVGANGARLVSVSRDKTLKVWQIESGYCIATLQAHDEWVRCVAVAPSGDALYTGSSDHSLKAFKLDAAGRLTEQAQWRGHEHVVEVSAVDVCTIHVFNGRTTNTPTRSVLQ